MGWLDRNPPARSQFRRGRRAKIRPVIVVHTAESVMDTIGADTGAENVAAYIQRRDTPGSYHRLVDSDSIVDLVDLDNEAFHDGTGSNKWSYGLSAACRTSDWAKMSKSRHAGFVKNLVAAAVEMNNHAIKVGAGKILARRITREQSERGESGFISHGERDPARRTDPGNRPGEFPWDQFLNDYAIASGQKAGSPPPDKETFLMALNDKQQEDLYQAVMRIEKAIGGLTDAAKATRAWVRTNGERIEAAVAAAGGKVKSSADLSKRANELNK